MRYLHMQETGHADIALSGSFCELKEVAFILTKDFHCSTTHADGGVHTIRYREQP